MSIGSGRVPSDSKGNLRISGPFGRSESGAMMVSLWERNGDVPKLRQIAGWQTDIVLGVERTAWHRWRRRVRFGSQAKA